MRRAKRRGETGELIKDGALIFLSVLIAMLLARSNILEPLLRHSMSLGPLGSFFVGMFFTSIFTTAPAIVVLAQIAQGNGILATALPAAMGAVIGDLLIFQFVKDRLSVHIVEVLKHESGFRRLGKILRFRYFRWLTFLVGGVIIASPLPDELGVSMLGMSRMRTFYFVPLSFMFNFLGVVLIGLVASSS